MNLLVEIGHPAHVHFFKNPTRLLEERGWHVHFVARDKAETLRLLDDEGRNYQILAESSSNLRKAARLLPEALQIYKMAKRRRIKVLAGIHAVHSAIARRMIGVPLTCFSDTDSAIEQMIIYVPNATTIHTPRSFRFNLGRKQKRYPGFHELSYLHPKYFKPDRSLIEEAGLLENGPPIVVRMIRWGATHDFGVRRQPWEVEFIERFGKEHTIVISSEGSLPRQLQRYKNPLEPSNLHHLLAHSKLYVGSGGTTASESAMLGTPAIYTNPLHAGIFNELQHRYHLVYQLTKKEDILSRAENVLEESKSVYESRRNALLRESIDVASYVANAIEICCEVH